MNGSVIPIQLTKRSRGILLRGGRGGRGKTARGVGRGGGGGGGSGGRIATGGRGDFLNETGNGGWVNDDGLRDAVAVVDDVRSSGGGQKRGRGIAERKRRMRRRRDLVDRLAVATPSQSQCLDDGELERAGLIPASNSREF